MLAATSGGLTYAFKGVIVGVDKAGSGLTRSRRGPAKLNRRIGIDWMRRWVSVNGFT